MIRQRITFSITTCLVASIVTCCIFSACDNPFAPRLVTKPLNSTGLGDQTTEEGLFQNFRIAYMTKDTLVYGRLLDTNFTFVYRDYDKGIDKTWGRDEDMVATTGLFQGCESLDLIWNDVVTSIGDSVLRDITRSFNLTITFSASDVVYLQGRVNLRIARATPDDKWKIQIWRDESNF